MRFVPGAIAIAASFVLGAAAFLGARYVGAITSLPNDPKEAEQPLPQEIAFRDDCFGRASFVGCETGGGIVLRADSARAEFVHHRSPQSRFHRASRSVGRLDFRVTRSSGDKIVVPCTGVLISDNRVLTANHCRVDSKNREAYPTVSEVLFVLGFRYGESAELFLKVSSEPVDACTSAPGDDPCGAADFAVYQLAQGEAERARGAGFTPATLGVAEPQVGQDLFIVHHPAGLAQMLSIKDCFVSAPGDQHGAFLHGCWTAGGSSGAPIFDDASGAVVGIHLSTTEGIVERDVSGVGVSAQALRARSQTISGVQ